MKQIKIYLNVKCALYSPLTDLRIQVTGYKCVSSRPSQGFSRPNSMWAALLLTPSSNSLWVTVKDFVIQNDSHGTCIAERSRASSPYIISTQCVKNRVLNVVVVGPCYRLVFISQTSNRFTVKITFFNFSYCFHNTNKCPVHTSDFWHQKSRSIVNVFTFFVSIQ